MKAITLGALLADASQAGAYFVDLRDREDLVEAANTLKYVVAPIDLKACTGDTDALERIADALAFPSWFGGNLDALEDCLNDLSWHAAEGYVLLLEHTGDWRAHEDNAFDVLLDILNEAAARWAQDRVPFWAFILLGAHELEQVEDAAG